MQKNTRWKEYCEGMQKNTRWKQFSEGVQENTRWKQCCEGMQKNTRWKQFSEGVQENTRWKQCCEGMKENTKSISDNVGIRKGKLLDWNTRTHHVAECFVRIPWMMNEEWSVWKSLQVVKCTAQNISQTYAKDHSQIYLQSLKWLIYWLHFIQPSHSSPLSQDTALSNILNQMNLPHAVAHDYVESISMLSSHLSDSILCHIIT